MPVNGLERLRHYNAIYFGAFGHPLVPEHVVRLSWWRPVCITLNHSVSILPMRLLPGIRGPLRDREFRDIDWVLVRDNGEPELTRDPRVGGFKDSNLRGFRQALHRAAEDRPHRGADAAQDLCRRSFEIMRLALEVARARARPRICVISRSEDVAVWNRAIAATRSEYPEVTIDIEPLEAITTRIMESPRSLDTIVATGSHANILESLGLALIRGYTLLPRLDLDPTRCFPSMFRPAHGPAFDGAGNGAANPIAAIWAGSLMLEHLGERDAAARLLAAIEDVTARGIALPPDLGGKATIREVAGAALAAIHRTSS
jgi:tartrate dehydrogenase/decarboxylase/D-malate dehydrogenase